LLLTLARRLMRILRFVGRSFALAILDAGMICFLAAP
jgi:hypothetical protein